MRTTETSGIVPTEHSVTVSVPTHITPGIREVVAVLPADPSAVSEVSTPTTPPGAFTAGWPVFDLQLAAPNATFRRDDTYGGDGR